MARSKLDLEHGDAIRAHALVACPQCGASTIWRGVPEYELHVRQCRIIALGLAVGALTAPEELLPTVPKKPRGWEWGR